MLYSSMGFNKSIMPFLQYFHIIQNEMQHPKNYYVPSLNPLESLAIIVLSTDSPGLCYEKLLYLHVDNN